MDKPHFFKGGRTTAIVEGLNFCPRGQTLEHWLGECQSLPFDDLERKLAGAQGSHHEAPPLGRIRQIVAPAAQRNQQIQV